MARCGTPEAPHPSGASGFLPSRSLGSSRMLVIASRRPIATKPAPAHAPMSLRDVAAQEFVLAYLAVAGELGEIAAITDPRVQTARRRYQVACLCLRRVA